MTAVTTKTDVTVVVPTFNERGNVRELVRRVAAAFAQDRTAVEILFVDDSLDDTPAMIEAAAEEFVGTVNVRLIHREGHTAIGGLSGAVVEGIRAAHGEHVIVMDGDLQHPPELGPRLLRTAQIQSRELVVASRYCGDGDAGGLESGLRRVVSTGSSVLARLLFPVRVGRASTDPMTGYFCVRRSSIDLDRLRPRGFKILLEILASHDLRVSEVPLDFGERTAGESKASVRNGLSYLLQLLDLRFARTSRFALIGFALVVLNLMTFAAVASLGRDYPFGVATATAFAAWVLLSTRRASRSAYVSRHGHARAVVVERVGRWAQPPDDREKYAYLDRPQHRWIFCAQFIAFVGVAISLYGMAQNDAWTLIFFVPLGLYGIEQVLALRTSTYQRRVTMPDHLFLVETYAPALYPSVDVFLPTAGEPVEMLRNTYSNVNLLDWPGPLTNYVLDDADRPEVEELAAEFGFRYIARPGNSFKKAGNLQYGLERSDGEFVTILDADFVPRPDFLHELIPYTAEGRTGIVQSPQYFATGKEQSWLERCAGATQEVFYRFIQPSRDAVGASICVGTSAIYRREALEEIGGFPQIGHSEDVYTGVAMNRVGYGTQYVPVLVSKGKSPDDLKSFISQQYRWAEGSLSLATDHAFHTELSMSIRQRLSYWAGFLYYITTAINAIFAPLAVLTMVWLFPDRVESANVLPLLGAVACWMIMLPLVSFGRWRVEVLRVQAIYGFAHLFCIFDLVRGKPAAWVATNAGGPSPLAARVTKTMAIYVIVSQAAIGVGITMGAIHYGFGRYWASIALALLSSYVYVPVAWIAVKSLVVNRAKSTPSASPAPAQAAPSLGYPRSDYAVALVTADA